VKVAVKTWNVANLANGTIARIVTKTVTAQNYSLTRIKVMAWYKHIDGDVNYQNDCCNLLDEDLLQEEKLKQEQWHQNQEDESLMLHK